MISSNVQSDKLPLITVGVTCFNASPNIKQALDSALAQDWPHLEVIVVDDGSSDGSQKILSEIAATDTRVRIIEQSQNLGCAAARNILIREAKGEFLAFFDDDDVSRPDRLRLQRDLIVTYEHGKGARLVACYGSGQRVYPNGYVMPIRAVGSDGPAPVGAQMADYLLFHKQIPEVFYGGGTPTCSLMARTAIFRDTGGFDPCLRRQEDVDFAVRLAFRGGHFIGIPEPVLNQYATQGGEKSAFVEFESFLAILAKNEAYLRAEKCYDYMRWWAEMRYRHFAGQDGHAVLMLARLLAIHPVRTIRHFLRSALRRYRHERRMRAPHHG